MMNLGEFFKEIRTNKGYSQRYMAKNILNQSSYSKVEKRSIDLTTSKYICLLEKLDMEHEEFQFIANNYKYKNKTKLVKTFFNLKHNDENSLKAIKTEAQSYLLINDDKLIQDIVSICDGLIILAKTNDVQLARSYVNEVWTRLEKFDNWYLTELSLINTILFIFPIETAINITEKALKQLEKYQKYDGSEKLVFNFQFNLVLLLLDAKHYKAGLKVADDVIELCKRNRFYYQLAICYARKGILLTNLKESNGEEFYQKAFQLLNIMEEDDIKIEVEKEIDHYTK